jgi:hypothetical protein
MSQPLKVNFTDEEAGSKVREIPPTGEYLVAITDGEIKEVKPGRKNTGKPFWQLRLVIQDGAYAGTTLISSVMLFDGALYSFSQLMKALDYDVNTGDFKVPDLDDIIGKNVNVRGNKMPAKSLPDGTDLSERFEVKGFKPPARKDAKVGDSSLLP